MSKKPGNQDPLRTAAEAQFTHAPKPRPRPPEILLHELQIYQIELEMQNEQLRQAQLELEKSRDRYVDFYDFAPAGYLTLSQEALINEINLPGAALLGAERSRLLQRRFASFVAPQDRDRWHRHFLTILKHDSKLSCELALQHNGGSRFYAQLDCLRLEKEGHKPVVRIVLTDITERKRIEQELLDMDQHKDEFLAMLAHELRNPLAPIRNAAHVLGRLGLAEPKVKWAQKIIEEQVSHLSRLVDDLLDVSRIARGKIALKREAIEFAALAEQAIESARMLAESKGQQLAVRMPDQAVQLEGDPVRLSQLLFNLLDNAVKYTPDGGRIEFAAHLDGTEIEISVRDNGMGIAAELLPRVFDLFRQGERTLDRAQGGLGIGLTLVRRLVGMHGGRVEAHSAGPGQGSTFTVRLPARAMPALPAKPAAENRSSPAAGMRVLVVDDDHAVADSTAMLLEMEGCEARIAESGQAALEQIPEFRPQVVLLDIGMKGMNGFKTAQRLRQLPEGRDLCLVAVTGYADSATRAQALASGCDHFLVKPVTFKELSGLLCKTGPC